MREEIKVIGKLIEKLQDKDDKPTVVRQCLGALHEVALYHQELCKIIVKELQSIDLSKYKDSMAPLIQKDINELLKVVE